MISRFSSVGDIFGLASATVFMLVTDNVTVRIRDIAASNYNTTANIYAHLESNSKELTGNAMQGNLTISGNLAAMQE